jgi:hypothetical protein
MRAEYTASGECSFRFRHRAENGPVSRQAKNRHPHPSKSLRNHSSFSSARSNLQERRMRRKGSTLTLYLWKFRHNICPLLYQRFVFPVPLSRRNHYTELRTSSDLNVPLQTISQRAACPESNVKSFKEPSATSKLNAPSQTIEKSTAYHFQLI